MNEPFFDRRDRIRSRTVDGQCWIRHHFAFGENADGARRAVTALTEWGLEYAQSDREGGSDAHWYVLAWGWTTPDGAVDAKVEEQMQQLAATYGGEYGGWVLQRNADGTLPDGREPLF